MGVSRKMLHKKCQPPRIVASNQSASLAACMFLVGSSLGRRSSGWNIFGLAIGGFCSRPCVRLAVIGMVVDGEARPDWPTITFKRKKEYDYDWSKDSTSFYQVNFVMPD
jgi:hypothetical protein